MEHTPTENARDGKVVYDPEVIGSTGLKAYGGFVSEEFLPELKGARGTRAYREMSDNDAVVGAIVFAITNLIRETKWNVEAAGDAPEQIEVKEFIESCMDDMSTSWGSVVDELCSMFVYGFAPLEILYKKRIGPDEKDPARRSKFKDGRVGLRGLPLRAQETIVRWELDAADGSIDGMWQQPVSGPMVFLPIEKMLLFRTTEVKQNPEGRSILRTAYRAWHYKKRIENTEAVGLERDLAGYPVAYIPGKFMRMDADAQEKATYTMWQSLVTSIKRDAREGIVIPSDRDPSGNLLFELKLMSSGGSRAIDTTKIIDRWQRAIATAVLADFIFLGQTAVGSFALSSDKTALFSTAIGAFLKSIGAVFNRHLIPRLMYLNGWDQDLAPKMVPEDIETPNIVEVADFISKLSSAGATFFPDVELENRLRQMAGLPDAPEEGMDMREHVKAIVPQALEGLDGNVEDAGGDGGPPKP